MEGWFLPWGQGLLLAGRTVELKSPASPIVAIALGENDGQEAEAGGLPQIQGFHCVVQSVARSGLWRPFPLQAGISGIAPLDLSSTSCF